MLATTDRDGNGFDGWLTWDVELSSIGESGSCFRHWLMHWEKMRKVAYAAGSLGTSWNLYRECQQKSSALLNWRIFPGGEASHSPTSRRSHSGSILQSVSLLIHGSWWEQVTSPQPGICIKNRAPMAVDFCSMVSNFLRNLCADFHMKNEADCWRVDWFTTPTAYNW